MKENLIHPVPEDLAAYRAGSLGPDFEQEIRNHLVECQECQELLLDLASLENSPMPDGDVSELELENAWLEQKQRLFPRPDLSRFGGWAAAAGLSFVVGVLGYEVRERWSAPANFYDVDLPRVIADERNERSVAVDLPVLELAPDQPGLLLLLLRNGLSHASFRAELFSEEKQSLLVRSGLSGQEDLLVIQIPPSRLPEGTVLVTVSGLNAEGDYEIVEDYSFRVQHP